MAVKYYQLKRGYWNGKVLIPIDAIEPFEEGTQPRTAVLVSEPEVADAAPKKGKAADKDDE